MEYAGSLIGGGTAATAQKVPTLLSAPKKARLIANKAGAVIDWPSLDAATADKVKRKINAGRSVHLKEEG